MKHIAILFILTISNSLFAQDYQLIENFDNNKNKWYINSSKNASSRIANGYFYLSHKRTSSSWRYWNNFNFETNQHFIITAKLKQTAGPNDYGYGIIWGANGWQNSYNFTISSNGMFTIWGYKNEELFEWKDWTISKKIKPLGQYNTLSVKKMMGYMYFYINDNLVYSHRFEEFFGSLSGFILGKNMNITVDNFKLKYPERKINVAGSVDPKFKKKNLGTGINSKYSEIAPIISPDGKRLYVARQNHPANFGSQKLYDIWYADRKLDGSWTSMKKMGKPINNDGDNLVIAVSPDGNTLMLEGLYSSTGAYIGDQGISISNRTANGWEIPKKIIIDDYYNLDEYESFCPTNDRSVMVMSVKRKDSYGSKDLYVSFLQANGHYGKPVNMGADLNSYLNEGTPFIAPDNKTLYFYSYVFPGYGSADIFVTKRLDNTWQKWSKPKNLGRSINSSDWDTYYSISAKGDYAYLVSSKGSYGAEDVFEIKMSEEAKPEPVVLMYGKVYNKKTEKPIGVEIVYEDFKTGKKIGVARSNPRNGSYKIVLPYGKYVEKKKNLFLIPLEVGQTINMQTIQFERGTAVFKKSSYSELKRLVELMKKHPKMEIELLGHTDTRGNPKLLLRLSYQRVFAVKNHLLKNNISSKRIKGKGYGGTMPLGIGTDEIEIKNRRVEYKILKM